MEKGRTKIKEMPFSKVTLAELKHWEHEGDEIKIDGDKHEVCVYG